MNNLFDLSKVNWIECDRYACSSYVTLASEMWNSGVKSTKEISNIIKLSQSHVAGYLKKGTILGMCDYDPEEVKIIIAKRNAIHNKKRIVQLDVNDKVISIWDSITDACLGTGLGNSDISNVCTGRNLTAGGYKWMYKEDYEKLLQPV